MLGVTLGPIILNAAVRKSGGPEVRWSKTDAADRLFTFEVNSQRDARDLTSGLPELVVNQRLTLQQMKIAPAKAVRLIPNVHQ